MILKFIFSTIVGYLLGCSSMSFYISKLKHINIKEQGSMNYGTSNTLMLAGKGAGVAVFLHDLAKAIIPTLLFSHYFGAIFGALAGCTSVLGHIFPFYLKFDGGKGYAPFIGVVIALNPLYGIISLAVSLLFVVITDKIVASTFTYIVAAPIFFAIRGDYMTCALLSITSIVIFIKHTDNIINLITRNGKEVGVRSVLFKKKGE